MSILSYLPYFNKQSLHTCVAQELVETCLPVLTANLQRTTGGGMVGSAEYRGYVRARANWLVDNAMDEVMEEFQIRPSSRESIRLLAVERLVGHLVGDVVANVA